jgi:hypothetical protein
MNKSVYNIKIINEKFGVLLDETFVDYVQFKLFLKMVDGSIQLNEKLSFYNGDTFLVNIPHQILVNSIITTSSKELDVVDHVRSKIEALVTK